MDISKNNDIFENKMNDNFKLPIELNSQKKKIFENLKYDLELIKNNENNKLKLSFYKNLFDPKTIVGNKIMEKWSNYYTSDKEFLKDNQKLYQLNYNLNCESCDNMWNLWKSVKNDSNFYNKYLYLSWDKVKFLNESSLFLFLFSVYSILSPLLNVFAPLIILIMPFFILKIMKVPINYETYSKILIAQLNKQIFGKLFTNFNSITMKEKLYSILTFGMYIYNIYQNIIAFYNLNKNIFFISDFYNKTCNYLEETSKNINIFLDRTKDLNTLQGYELYVKNEKNKLDSLLKDILQLKNIKYNFNSFKKLGDVFKQFYLITKNNNIENTLLFTFGFNGYIDNINGLHKYIKSKELNKCSFKENNCVEFKNCYLPFIETNRKIIKNNINLKKNLIITGPNAAGKTTLIKITLLNIIICQQTGYGFFSKGIITPYDYLHCYINIPDTSSRDSLFQAEARRCKNILDIIEENPDSKHLCIFDELYSGTNPDEAIASAYSYLKKFSNNKNIKFLLTTHFLKICNLFNKNKNVKNYKMESIIDKKNNVLLYNYKLKKGISKIKGGIYVLKDLDFPNDIIKTANNIIKKL